MVHKAFAQYCIYKREIKPGVTLLVQISDIKACLKQLPNKKGAFINKSQ